MSSAKAEDRDAERTLQSAGLSSDGPALLSFFHARSRADVDPDRLRVLLEQLAASSNSERNLATAEFLGLGPLAVPTLRRAANTLENPELARRAAHCLRWLEGSASASLPAAAARLLGRRKPAGAAAALLAYLPFADSPEVIRAVTAALAAAAAMPNGKPDPALLRGLTDPMAVRRAAAGVALARAAPPDQVAAVRKLLTDPARGVRLRTALALGEANDAEAIPVLIDLLGELPADERQPVEEFLTELAGEWAPPARLGSEDEVARNILRDAWRAWWRNTNGAALLGVLRQHTLTPPIRQKIQQLLVKLGDSEFLTREAAMAELLALGRLTLPRLRQAIRSPDREVARRARQLVEDIERDPGRVLPAAAVRMLGLRKPEGAVEALLAYLPFAEEDDRTEEVKKALGLLARRGGKLDAALVCALADDLPLVRAVAAEALARGGGDGCAAVRALLQDKVPSVRQRAAFALVRAGERAGVPVLIDLLPVTPDEQRGEIEEALHQLAGESAPEMLPGAGFDDAKKRRDAWAAWWKVNAPRVDLNRIHVRPLLGFTLICASDRVVEVDRQGRTRWSIRNLSYPTDAWLLPGNRVLITEWNACRVTERDLEGNVLWKKDGLPSNPVYAQRLSNGNTFIAIRQGTVLEVDRAGKEVSKIDKVPGLLYAYRARGGAIVCLTRKGRCLTLDAAGKPLRQFALKYPIVQRGGLDLLPDGRIVIASEQAGKVMQYNGQGKLLREWDVSQATTATALPNGRLLVSSENGRRVVELDRSGKIVWEQTNLSPYRARRR